MAVFWFVTCLFSVKIAGLRILKKILFGLNGLFGGQKESFKTVLGSILGFFHCYYSELPWPDPN